ncbi:MAG: hypothetical protein ACXABY_12885, partial [Candidatus Thorarchaeota archaeon]
ASLTTIPTTASDIAIVDADGYYDSTEVEGALQEIGEDLSVVPSTASEISIVDTDGYYTSVEVEGALQEIGASLTTIPSTAVEITIADADGYYDSGDVEGALREVGESLSDINLTAVSVAITDADGYWDSTEVENALREVGEQLSDITAPEVRVIDEDGYYASIDVEGVLVELATLRTDFLSGHIAIVENKDYHLLTNAPFAGQITNITTKDASGTADGYVEIDGYKINTDALSITSTELITPYTANNVFGYGSDIDLVTSANASALDLKFTTTYNRFLSPPGIPAIWVASRFEDQADGATVTEMKNYGSLGGRLTTEDGYEPLFETSGTPTKGLPYTVHTPSATGQDQLFLDFADQSGDPTVLIAGIFRATGASTNGVLAAVGDYTTGAGAYIYQNVTNFRFRVDNTVPFIDSAYTSNVWHIGAFKAVEGENSTAWLDGNTTISSNGSPTISTAWDRFSLGGKYVSGTFEAHSGDIGEILVYFGSNAPTVEEVTTYLTSIYGTTPQT